MESGHARVAQRTDPRKVRIMYQGRHAWDEIWRNNPRIATLDEEGDFQLLYAKHPRTNMRAYHTAKAPTRWTYNLDFRPEVGEIYLTEAERAFGAQHAGRVIIEPHIKAGASPNKQWGWARWNKLAWLLSGAGIRVTQLGPNTTELLDGADFIATPTFRMAAAVLATAHAACLPEGATHHAAAALGIPAVVIFGGYIAVETTGYSIHRNLGVSVGEACGMRLPCKHCAVEMAKITPERVFTEMMEIIG
jgi:ADP-heptose:LPS heptosyltransferase